MQINYGQLKEGLAEVAAALADARSARNLASRRRAREAREEREAEWHRRRRKRKSDEELEELLRRRVRVRVPKEEQPRIGTTTARKLFHRTEDMLLGSMGLSDSRGPDGLCSIHFAFTARGFKSSQGRRWRTGESERAARYIVREDALEGGENGWWSSIAEGRTELVAFYRALEELERHDRCNANVYISEIIALPHELSARQRRKAVRRICRFFDKLGLPYTVAIHLPDQAGDQRNYHVHLIYSLRPCKRTGPYDWSFGVTKMDDVNTAAGIKGRRVAVVQAINATLCAARSAKRYTHLSNKARRMAAAQPKIGQEATWVERRLRALEERAARLRQMSEMVTRLREAVGSTALRLRAQNAVVRQRLFQMHNEAGTPVATGRMTEFKNLVRQRLSLGTNAVSACLREASGMSGLVAAQARARLRSMSQQLDESQAARSSRLATTGAMARTMEGRALLLYRQLAVQRALSTYRPAMLEARKATVAWLDRLESQFQRNNSETLARLGNLSRISKRVEFGDRLLGLLVEITETASKIESRLGSVKQVLRSSLAGYGVAQLSSQEWAKRLSLLGVVAERRHSQEQRLAAAPMPADRAERRTQSRGDHERKPATVDEGPLHQRAANAATASPAFPSSGRDQRGTERRKAIAAAAQRLRRASFPPQARTANGFAISPRFADSYRDVDRFEAEVVIQKIHLAKRAQMLAAARRQIEQAERSPFVQRDDRMQIPMAFFEQPLRRAVQEAARDDDLIQLVNETLLYWREREAKAREARKIKQREAAERRKRMQTGVEKVYAAVRLRIEDGRFQKTVIAGISEDVQKIAQGVIDGRLAMRGREDLHFYSASRELRATVAKLCATTVGRQIVVGFGKLTSNESFEPSELSIGWTLSRPKPQPTGAVEVHDAALLNAWKKKGAER